MSYGEKNPRLDSFRKQLDAAEQNQSKYANKWRHYERVYLGTVADRRNDEKLRKRYGGVKKYYPPYVFEQIETIKPRLVEPDPDFDWVPTEPTDDSDALRRVKYLHRKQFADDRLVDKQEEFAHDGLIKGLFVGKVVWERKQRTLRFNRKLNTLQRLAGIQQTVQRDVLVANRPTIIRVDPYDFFWDPSCTNDDNWQYVFHRSWLTSSQLRRRASAGIYDAEQVEALITGGKNHSGEFESEDAQKARQKDRFEVMERWMLEKGGVSLMVVGNRCKVLKDAPSDFWHGQIPFKADSLIRTPDDLVGISPVSLIEDSQAIAWDMDNDQRDAVKKSLNPPFKYVNGMKGGRDFKIVPDGRIGLDSMNQIEQLDIKANGVWGREDMQFLLGRMQSTLGATPYMSGASPTGSGFNQDTATGASILSQAAGQRMMLNQLHMQGFLARCATICLQLNQQFLTEDQQVRVAGGAIIDVAIDDIAQVYDARPKMSSISANREAEKQKYSELLNVFMPLEGRSLADGTIVTVRGIAERLVDAAGVDRETVFLVPGPPIETLEPPPGAAPQAVTSTPGEVAQVA